MTNISKFLVFSVLVLSAVFTQVNTLAYSATSDQFIVTAKNGLNVRDANCNRIDTLSYGLIVYGTNAPAINCNVNGLSYQFYAVEFGSVGNIQYMAKDFLSPVNGSAITTLTADVTATAGLNVRDANCKRLATFPYNANLSMELNARGINCQVNGVYFYMQPVLYNGNTAYVASTYLRAR